MRTGIEERVYRFADLMIEKLRSPKNEAKGDWKDCDPLWLMSRLEEEAVELRYALRNKEGVPGEAVDVANFAMMIVDVLEKSDVSGEK